MNRLAFGEFHEKHFSAQQKDHWMPILFQQQQYAQRYDPAQSNLQHQQSNYDPNHFYSQYQHSSYYSYEQPTDEQCDAQQGNTSEYEQYDPQQENTGEYEQYDNAGEYYDEDYVHDQQYEDGEEYQDEDEHWDYGGLSKEAIEIFEFSEAYRKEKELEKQKQEDEDKEGMDNWQYDESNVHCSGGLEAPATSLVILKSELERPPKNSKLRIQEELLNSMYLSSCLQDSSTAVLWPVIPFKM